MTADSSTGAPAEGTVARRLQLLLRVSMAGTYIGHGAFGVIGKAAWVPYFNLFGLSESQAWALMPVVGILDITLGILILAWPTRAVMLHLACWGVLTASFRPLVGEGTWQEVFERAGNYCVPLALLVLTGWGGDSITAWFRRVRETPSLTLAKARAMHWILRGGTALLLIGHGGFGVWMHKQVWLDYFGALGIGAETVADLRLLYVVGWFEIGLGLAVLYKPARGLLGFVCAYKVGSELLRPAAGEPWWEFIERAGSYVAPVALIMVDRWRAVAGTLVVGDAHAPAEVGAAVLHAEERSASVVLFRTEPSAEQARTDESMGTSGSPSRDVHRRPPTSPHVQALPAQHS